MNLGGESHPDRCPFFTGSPGLCERGLPTHPSRGGLGRMGQSPSLQRPGVSLSRRRVDARTTCRSGRPATGEWVIQSQFLGSVLMIHPPRLQPALETLARCPSSINKSPTMGLWAIGSMPPALGEVVRGSRPASKAAESPSRARRQLHRFWQSQFTSGETLPIGRRTDLKLDSPSRSMRFYAESFQPHQRPGVRFEPQPFDPKAPPPLNGPLVLARLTVDGNTEQFWLEAQQSSAMKTPVTRAQRRAVVGKDRRVEITLVPDSFDVGFYVYLDRFQRTLDPGSSMASSYSSLVDFVTVKTDPKTGEDRVDQVIEDGVLITLNQPITRKDPATGRSFRIYQEAFRGPWKPGDRSTTATRRPAAAWRRHAARRVVPLVVTVNYDPGRGLEILRQPG